jgi:ABC-2 type transport system ATP-binding protein
LLIEVDEGTEQLKAELARRGMAPRPFERAVLVRLASDQTYDTVRDVVADLGLPLNRMEQRRHHVEELFRGDERHERREPGKHSREQEPAELVEVPNVS